MHSLYTLMVILYLSHASAIRIKQMLSFCTELNEEMLPLNTALGSVCYWDEMGAAFVRKHINPAVK